MANKVFTYLRETRGEFNHVKWLTRKQLIGFTVAVIVVSLAIAVFLGAFDFLFSSIIRAFVI